MRTSPSPTRCRSPRCTSTERRPSAAVAASVLPPAHGCAARLPLLARLRRRGLVAGRGERGRSPLAARPLPQLAAALRPPLALLLVLLHHRPVGVLKTALKLALEHLALRELALRKLGVRVPLARELVRLHLALVEALEAATKPAAEGHRLRHDRAAARSRRRGAARALRCAPTPGGGGGGWASLALRLALRLVVLHDRARPPPHGGARHLRRLLAAPLRVLREGLLLLLLLLPPPAPGRAVALRQPG
mmetsp:Transcript_41674/g.135142  ORF Transcript_41674/g.135142 Transcript_41674/m.135142 type:complete len:248 (-) Transcript_41674:797-1540(-)